MIMIANFCDAFSSLEISLGVMYYREKVGNKELVVGLKEKREIVIKRFRFKVMIPKLQHKILSNLSFLI